MKCMYFMSWELAVCLSATTTTKTMLPWNILSSTTTKRTWSFEQLESWTDYFQCSVPNERASFGPCTALHFSFWTTITWIVGLTIVVPIPGWNRMCCVSCMLFGRRNNGTWKSIRPSFGNARLLFVFGTQPLCVGCWNEAKTLEFFAISFMSVWYLPEWRCRWLVNCILSRTSNWKKFRP